MSAYKGYIYDIFNIENGNELCNVTFTASPTSLILQNGNIVQQQSQGISYTLPFDVIIRINGSKLLAKSQILDGATVFERITKQVHEIQFDFTLRDISAQAAAQMDSIYPVSKYPYQNKFIVAIEWLNFFIQNIWNKDAVLQVDNILLKTIGIQQVIVDSYSINTIRGNVDMPMTLKCYEDYYSTKNQGTTLLIV